jgi:hypothetical protein
MRSKHAQDEVTGLLACAERSHARLNQSWQETVGCCRTASLNPRLPPKLAARIARARRLGFLPLAVTVVAGKHSNHYIERQQP